jgi:16S rRNA G966 N2-methylase RsmD
MLMHLECVSRYIRLVLLYELSTTSCQVVQQHRNHQIQHLEFKVLHRRKPVRFHLFSKTPRNGCYAISNPGPAAAALPRRKVES